MGKTKIKLDKKIKFVIFIIGVAMFIYFYMMLIWWWFHFFSEKQFVYPATSNLWYFPIQLIAVILGYFGPLIILPFILMAIFYFLDKKGWLD